MGAEDVEATRAFQLQGENHAVDVTVPPTISSRYFPAQFSVRAHRLFGSSAPRRLGISFLNGIAKK